MERERARNTNDRLAIDGSGLRDFLRYGFPWNLDDAPIEARDDAQRDRFHLNLASLGIRMADAYYRGNDKAGIVDAGNAIIAEVQRRQAEKEGD